MDQTWRILGDGLCIAALAVIASVSLNAWKRIPAHVKVPLPWGGGRERIAKAPALLYMPIGASVLLMSPTLLGITFSPATTGEAILLFVVRGMLAASLTLVHIFHIGGALVTLRNEGSLLY